MDNKEMRMELQKKLNKIQTTLKAPKNQFNDFGKYKYRNCEDILNAVKPLLDGCILTINDNIHLVGDRFYVEATATISFEKEEISTNAFAREPAVQKGMNEAQITGATSSYARKYALDGLFCIDDTRDNDTKTIKKTSTVTLTKKGTVKNELTI